MNFGGNVPPTFGGAPMGIGFKPVLGLLGVGLPILLLSIALFFLMSGILMWLWNITITRIFNIREITYWEAFRLLIIAGILLGKFGFNMNL